MQSIQKKQLRLNHVREERGRYETYKQELLARIALVQSHLSELRNRNSRLRYECS